MVPTSSMISQSLLVASELCLIAQHTVRAVLHIEVTSANTLHQDFTRTLDQYRRQLRRSLSPWLAGKGMVSASRLPLSCHRRVRHERR